MFNSNLIMAVKVDGKVLREFDGTVALPFGSEYSIFLKNNSSRRASVAITIDGQDVLDGTSVIVNANSSVELRRFIKNGNLETGNTFKFIEKTDKIEAFRGNNAEDGLLTVTYSFERQLPQYSGLTRSVNTSVDSSYSNFLLKDYTGDSWTTISVANYCGYGTVSAATAASLSTNNAGITAPGSVVSQKFSPVHGFVPDGTVLTMTLKMVGAVDEKPLTQPVTVKRKVRCTMCGTYCKQTAKFCHECGASVVIV